MVIKMFQLVRGGRGNEWNEWTIHFKFFYFGGFSNYNIL